MSERKLILVVTCKGKDLKEKVKEETNNVRVLQKFIGRN